MNTNFKTMGKLTLLVLTTFSLLTSCSSNTAELKSKISTLEAELKSYKDAEVLTQERLVEFDSLDYKYYTNQEWEKFSHSHKDDIVVYNADGSVSKGLFPNHINDLKPMFVFAPDTRIEEHPVKFGNGEWTAVIGVIQGTFTEPMPIGNGKTIPPTGKAFKMKMATIAHWDGTKMTEEYLFYDSQIMMKQIGLAQ